MTFDAHTIDVPLADPQRVVEDAWARGWSVPPPLTVSEWANANRWLTREGAAEPGPWRTERTPYLREIMDVLSDEHPCKKAVLMASTQVGKTEVLNNFCGYIVGHSPGPTMVVMPTEKLAQRWSKQRLAPMIKSSPALRPLIRSANARDSGNTTLMKEFEGGMLVIAGANSSSDLRSMPARRILADEVDEYPLDIDDQGSPLELAERRASTFTRRKLFVSSSPRTKAVSVINREYEASDKRRYHVPCPYCDHYQPLDIDNLTDDGEYACCGCGSLIAEHHKTAMLDAGVWIAQQESDVPGFHLNALYAPIGLGYTWLEIAQLRKQAQAIPERQVTFTNTIAGLPFEGERTQADAIEVEGRAEEDWESRTLPPGALVLTVGVDCQLDRFAIQWVAWGRGEHSWVIDYEEIPGDPSNHNVGYADLDAALQRTFANHYGAQLVGVVVAIDGGNWTEEVAKFVRTRQRRAVRCGAGHCIQHVMVVRGRSHASERVVYRPRKTESNMRGNTIARSLGVWGVGTEQVKEILFGRIAGDAAREDIDSRMVRFPRGLSTTYYTGLTSEFYDHARRRWVKPKGVRNEPLDTWVYAYFAALCPFAAIDRKRDHEWAQLEASLTPRDADLFSAPDSPPADVPRVTDAVESEPLVPRVPSRGASAPRKPETFGPSSEWSGRL